MEGQTQLSDVPVIKADQVEQLSFLPLINAELTGIAKVKEDLKVAKEKLESELLQHENFVSAKETAKTAREALKDAKEMAMQSSLVATLTDEVKDLQDKLKLSREVLSDYAVQYADRTGQSEINTYSGDRLIIKKSAKLVKPPKK